MTYYFIEPSNIVKNYNCPETAFLPHSIVIPLNKEKDSTYIPVVNIGDHVEEGQIIATHSSKTNLHSSIPGTVTAIEPCPCPNGKQQYAIKIKFGGQFTFVGKNIFEKKSELILKSQITEKLISNGVLNNFDVSYPQNLGLQIQNITKISDSKKAKNLVVRLFDEDNYRYTDSLISKYYFPQLVEAAKTLIKSFDAERILFAYNLKDEKKDEYLSSASDQIKLVGMNIKRYPSGTIREIISAYRRSVKKDQRDLFSKNDLFIDASSLFEVYKSVNKDIPSVSKHIFLYGNCLKASGLLEVRIGTTIRDLVNQIGGFSKEPKLVIVNGMINGTSITSLDTPITQYVKSVTFLSKNKLTDKQIYACINCGNCRFMCPVKISPDIIYNNLIKFKKMPEEVAKTSLACTNCGLCNIDCPARLPLCQSIMFLKNQIISDEGLTNDK